MCSSWVFFSDSQMERAAKGPTQAEFNVPVELHWKPLAKGPSIASSHLRAVTCGTTCGQLQFPLWALFGSAHREGADALMLQLCNADFFFFFFQHLDFLFLLAFSALCFLAASNRSRWSWWLKQFMKPSASGPFPAKSFNEEPGSVSVKDLKRRPSIHTRDKRSRLFLASLFNRLVFS